MFFEGSDRHRKIAADATVRGEKSHGIVLNFAALAALLTPG